MAVRLPTASPMRMEPKIILMAHQNNITGKNDGQQPPDAASVKGKRIPIFLQGLIDPKARHKDKHLHRAQGVPFRKVQIVVIHQAAVIVKQVAVHHHHHRQAHQLTFIPADAGCNRPKKSPPETLPKVIIADSLSKSNGIVKIL